MEEEIFHHNFDSPLTVPPRTGVDLEFNLEGEVRRLGYTCIDCGYATYELEKMQEHQTNQQQYHSLWQKLKRAISIRRKK